MMKKRQRRAMRAAMRKEALPTRPASNKEAFPKSGVLVLGGLAVAILVAALFLRMWPSSGPAAAFNPTTSLGAMLDRPAATNAPAAAQAPQPVATKKAPNYLSTSGSKIVDSEGNVVRLTGVNWFGMETQTFSPHGLWLRNWQDMLDQIAGAGFNTIRLPFASTILDPNARPMEGIDYKLNPDLRNLTALQIMDKIVTGAGQRSLKIILDQHRPNTDAQSKLWYTDFLSEAQWIADWETLARRYAGNDTIIGADLHNEPAGNAKWGGGDPKTDWKAAAERAGNAILDLNPHWLIIVEGVENVDKDGYWMGGNLAAAGANPVNLKVPNKLVYSTHDYGPGVYEQEWFKDKRFPANMPEIWYPHWAYLVEQGIAPVLVGEFGGKSVSDNDREGIWQQTLLRYMDERGVSFTYWSFNPNSVDTGGILKDDWQSVNTDKAALLSGYMSGKMAVNTPSVLDQSAVSAADRKNTLPAQPIKVQLAAGSSDPSDKLSLKLLILNQTGANVPLPELEMRYWLSAGDAALAGLAKPAVRDGKSSVEGTIVGIDWASVEGVTAALVADTNMLPYLRVTFGKNAGTLPGFGKVEVQARLVSPDKKPIIQTGQFSFKPSNAPADNDSIGLYLWGDRVWGKEPAAGSQAPAGADAGNESDPKGATTSGGENGIVAGTSVTGSADNSYSSYTVKPGDTLRKIAAAAYGDPDVWPRIRDANPGAIANPDIIQPAQSLLLPAR